MPLQSNILRGDAQLEAAAKTPSAHVTPGARGEHVAKIQYALARLTGEPLAIDGVYGPATAAAVLAFKKKYDIVNRSYQTSADDIVGVMTLERLDKMLKDLESANTPVGYASGCGCRVERKA